MLSSDGFLNLGVLRTDPGIVLITISVEPCQSLQPLLVMAMINKPTG
jgi:hypothetical protein